MKMFMLKSIILASLMFISALAGMQQANDGIQSMKGYEDPDFKNAVALKGKGDGEIHAHILGRDVTSHDIEAKKQQLEEIKAYNMFSSMGKKISEGISQGTGKLINLLSGVEDE